jgi:hypothetical protein
VLSITADTKSVERALEHLSADLEKTVVEQAVYPYLQSVQATAKLHHRYTRRTGKLSNAVVVVRNEHGGEVGINDASAPYGKYVHEGFKTWAPDKFLDDAAESNEHLLDTLVNKAAGEAIKKAGLQ